MAAASYVTVMLDLLDAQGRQLSRGRASMRPSWPLTDTADMQLIPPAAAFAEFGSRTTPSVQVLASDSLGPQPYGWTWDLEFDVPGKLTPRSVFIPAGPVAFTATSDVPAVFTWTPGAEPWELQTLPVGTGVQLSGHHLPLGFAAGAVYYVIASSGHAVQLAAVQGGPALASLSAGSGQLTVVQWQLSALTTVECAADPPGFMPLPNGTPSAGLVPVATGYGTGSAWTALSAADVGADASGAASAAQAAAEAASLPKTGGVVAGELSPTVTALTFDSTVAVDATAGNVFALAMTGACTLGNPTGGTDGQAIRLRVTSNGNTLTWGDAYDFGSAGEPSLSESGMDTIGFEFVASLSAWTFLGGGGQGFGS